MKHDIASIIVQYSVAYFYSVFTYFESFQMVLSNPFIQNPMLIYIWVCLLWSQSSYHVWWPCSRFISVLSSTTDSVWTVHGFTARKQNWISTYSILLELDEQTPHLQTQKTSVWLKEKPKMVTMKHLIWNCEENNNIYIFIRYSIF